MSLRIKADTAQDPDVEASRAELEIIEGKRHAAQSDVILIAENKKQVEAEKTETSAKLDAEIADKRDTSKRETDSHNALMASYDMQRTGAENKRDAAHADQLKAEKDRDAAKADAESESAHADEVMASIRSLVKQESDLKLSIATLTASEKKHKESESKAFEIMHNAVAELRSTRIDQENERKVFASEKQEHDALASTRETKQLENTVLDESIASKQKQESDLKNSIIELEKDIETRTAAAVKVEEDANKRLTNATNLEVRIDAKLSQLKEAEKEMTTEHLARIGYKPIGT